MSHALENQVDTEELEFESIVEAAAFYRQFFETITKESGKVVTLLTDNAPDELRALVRESLHDNGRLAPDDQIFEFSQNAFNRIAGAPPESDRDDLVEFEFDEITILNTRTGAIEWLGSNAFRPPFVDETLEALEVTEIPDGGILEMIRIGMIEEMQIIYTEIVDWLDDQFE